MNSTHPRSKRSKRTIIRPKIRQFQLSDLDDICIIEQLSFPHPWSESEFRLYYRREPQLFLVAAMNARIIGYVIAQVVSSLDPKKFQFRKRGHVVNIAVHPDFRRKGIGKSLIKTINAYLQEKGLKDVFLEVRASNSIARIFYLNLDFEEKGKKLGYYLTEDALIMVKKFNDY
ncbi:ribosomal protein S18-alanine N-acetyltransferase [[Eubacterium] cellulosolvens]